MDINKITSITELKAMAYDQLTTAETAQANLRVIQQRIEQVQQAEQSQAAKPQVSKKE